MDGLKYLFEINTKAPGLKEANQHLKEADRHIKDVGKHSESLSHTIRHEFGSVGKSIKDTKNELKELGEAFGLLLGYEATKEITEKIADLGKEIVKTAGRAESLSFSLDLNFGKQGGKQIEEWADRVQNVLPVTGAQAKAFAVDLGHAGIELKDVNRYIAAAADVAARSADKVEGFSSALTSMRRMAISGKLGARQLVQLGLPAENFDFLPGMKGLSKRKVLDRLEKMDLSTEEVFRAITGGKKLGEQGKEIGNLLETKVKNVTSLPEQYFEKWKDTPSFDVFKGKLDELFVSLDPNGPKGAEILKSWQELLTTLVDGIKKIDFKEVAADLKDLVVSMKELAGAMRTMTGYSGSAFHAVATGIETPHVMANMLRGQHDETTSTFTLNIAKHLPFIGKMIDETLSKDVGKQLGAGAAAGLQATMPAIKDAGADVVGAAEKGAREKGQIHSPSKLFADLGMMTAAGYAEGMRSQRGAVADATADMMYIPPRGRETSTTPAPSISVTFGDINVTTDGSPSASAAAFVEEFEARMTEALERLKSQRGIA